MSLLILRILFTCHYRFLYTGIFPILFPLFSWLWAEKLLVSKSKCVQHWKPVWELVAMSWAVLVARHWWVSWWRPKMTYMRSTEYPNCLSVEMTAQIKGRLGSHEYHLTHRAKKAAGMMGSSQLIRAGNDKGELTTSGSRTPLLSKICGYLQIFLLVWRGCPHY